MSVLKSNRKPSPVQFVDTAMKLCEHTIKYTRKQFAHKDYDLVRRCRDYAMDILESVTKANAIFPKVRGDIDKRRELFENTKETCFAFITLLSVIKNATQTNVSDWGWLQWGLMLDQEINLINSIMQSDQKRLA